ncbi:NAD-dependent epimerase/dehydratase family protein [Microbacterium sp.]|uniref:NAD-dependent epimerase/dehydratase family protein n=1 Tax=Microbacterium sp. TaxID=51671 RepID=UPI0028123643|nr:NAD-dependent epimerase/dehydratase family protein [Microbacterium sp.]
MTVRRWIIGRGLLGRAVARARRDAPFGADVPDWNDGDGTVAALSDALARFVAGAAPDDHLEISWTAGRAVTSTPAHRVFAEVDVFERFVAELGALPAETRARLTFMLASSVGGAWAASPDAPYTEFTPTAPASAYGQGKLAMEAALAGATAAGGWRSLVARVTNLYGPGQDLAKAQGLISILIRAHLTGVPASIYVPLDTLRDYVYEDDAARIISAASLRAGQTPAGTTTVKIVGSGLTVSIGALIGELRRLHRRRGLIVLGGGDARGQALDLRVRSRVWTDLDGLARTTLPEGLSRVYASQLASSAVRRVDG